MSLKGKYNAWIRANGHFIEVGYMDHENWAWEYFKERYGFNEAYEKIDELSNNNSASDALHNLGWVRLMTWIEGKSRIVGKVVNPKLTNRQKETIQDWCIDNDFNYDTLFKS